MLAAFIVTAIIGGALIVLSVIGAGQEAHADGAFDFGHHEVGHGGGHSDGSGEATGQAGPWIPFFSLRFWTYFCAVFGISGILLTVMTDVTEMVAGASAMCAGLVTGLAVAYSMRILRRSDSNSMAKPRDMLGTNAKVLVALRGEQPGRVRAVVKGDLVDMLALTQDGSTVEAGEDVVIVGVEGDRAMVVPRATIFD